VLPGSKLLLER